MRIFTKPIAILVFALPWTAPLEPARAHPDEYTAFSRYTDPGDFGYLLDGLPDDIRGICEVARKLTIHHLLLSYYGVPADQRDHMTRIWPPRMPDLLSASRNARTNRLLLERKPQGRIVGGCLMEAHFLAGLLRYKHVPVRVRAGFFQGIRTNSAHIVAFWNENLRQKGVLEALQEELPTAWSMRTSAFTRWQNAINHHMEHWICEYWDHDRRRWRLLDADNTFLKAHSDIDVGIHLPRKYFEYAHEAWEKMRSTADFNENQYFELPQDGRSHIRSQLLWDFFNLLNHDIAGAENAAGDAAQFVSKRKFAELSALELDELDQLAHVLSLQPDTDDLVTFYHQATTLRLRSAEDDPYSFVSAH